MDKLQLNRHEMRKDRHSRITSELQGRCAGGEQGFNLAF